MIADDAARTYREQFPIFDRRVYLNACSLGPLSRASRIALAEYADDWAEFGAPAWWVRWIPKIEQIRGLFAELIGTDVPSVTIHHSISSALTSVASAIDYTHRPKVVVAEIDFPTIAYQWLVRPDIEVVFARSQDGVTVPLEEYERLIDVRTAAVATSHVFYATGAIQDVGAIADIAHRRGAFAIVDGFHAVGVMPVDVEALGVDFYLGGTLKWLCGGPGLTFIYAAPHNNALRPRVTGWFASNEQFAFDTVNFEPAEGASRFQLGTPAVPTVYSAIPAMSQILEIGPSNIYERIQRLTRRVIEQALANGFRVVTPHDDAQRAGIVMLRHTDPAQLVDLLNQRSIVIDSRPGKVRISPHYFNTENDIDLAMEALTSVPNSVASS